jgi:hypothetical protein
MELEDQIHGINAYVPTLNNKDMDPEEKIVRRNANVSVVKSRSSTEDSSLKPSRFTPLPIPFRESNDTEEDVAVLSNCRNSISRKEFEHRHNHSYIDAILQCIISKPSKPPSSSIIDLEPTHRDARVAQASADILRNLCKSGMLPKLRISLRNYADVVAEVLPSFPTRK